MTNLEFENMAVNIVKNFPGPDASFEDLKKKKEKRIRHTMARPSGNRKKVLVAVLVIALVIVSGFSVYAGQAGNGMWAFYSASSTYLARFDLELPEQLASASMSEEIQWLKIVPHGTSWKNALINPLYTVASVTYYLDNSEAYCDISVGSTKNAYWESYFSYDDDVWAPRGSTGRNNNYSYGTVQTEEFEGMILYFSQKTMWGTAYENGSTSNVIVTWIDSENRICMNLNLLNSTDMDAAVACAKEIIKMNR
ncbi:MAG: hypothetical protein LUG99_03830 [Lachnospiraceae bacterium]|nr:hypothetical protein [Lachnospiraceae bacterium]MCD8012292.1 hypothetical protein [Lachnospiraceae bacterium]